MLIGAPLGFFGGGSPNWKSWTGANDGSATSLGTTASYWRLGGMLSCEISTGKVLSIYNASGTYGAIAATISGTSVTVGSSATPSTGAAGNYDLAAICQMSADTALFVSRSTALGTYARVVTTSGTTISFGAESSEITAANGSSAYGIGHVSMSVQRLTSTTALIVYPRGGYVHAAVLTISGTSVSGIGASVIVGASYDSNTCSCVAVALSSTVVVALYQGTTYYTATKLTVSGATVTVGSSSTTSSLESFAQTPPNGGQNCSISAIDSTKAVFAACNSGLYGYYGVIDASGSTPSFGTLVTSSQAVFASQQIGFDAATSSGIVSYSKNSRGWYGLGFSVSGSTITLAASPVNKSSLDNGGAGPALAFLSSAGRFVLTENDASTGRTGYMTVLAP